MFWVDLTKNLSSYMTVFLTAMTPVGELRASIPLALGTYHMNIFQSYIISVVGNLVPAIIILWILEPVSKFLASRFKIFNKFFTWLFNRTRKKHAKKFEKYSGYALIGFVGIPLPVTGAWTGALIAFVFGIPPKKAILHIFIGVLIAGIIVTAICKTVGYIKFITVG
jgi:uncharacterized membrane protein